MRKFRQLGFLFVALSMFGLPAMVQTPDRLPANPGPRMKVRFWAKG